MPNPNFFMRQVIWHLCCVILLLVTPCYAQTTRVKALQQRLDQRMPDTARLHLLQQLTEAYSTVDPQKKFYYANVYKSLADKLDNDSAAADAYIHMGISYGIRSRLDSALYYFSLAYNQAEKSKYLIGMGRSLADMGYAYDRLDDKQGSVKYYFQALAIYKKIGYERGINQCNTNIGSIYYDLKQYALAESYFRESLDNYARHNDQAGRASALYEIGNCYAATNRDTKALEYYNEALAIQEKSGDINGSSLTRKGLGTAYLHQSKYQQSIAQLELALKGMRTLQDKFQECGVLYALADVHLALRDIPKAESELLTALTLAQEVDSKITAAQVQRRLVEVYKYQNNINKAFEYQSAYLRTQDSILSEKAVKDVTLLEFTRIRGENAALTKNNQLIASKNTNYLARLNQYSNIMVIVVIVLLFVLVMMMVFYRRNEEKKATNKLLTRQKEEIALINEELGLLNEEINTQMELTGKQNVELERLNDVKNKFFSIVSHDLRSPLSTLQTLFAVYREGGIGEDEMHVLLAKLEDTLISTSTFLDNLLEWSKSQLEGITIYAVDFDINACITEHIRLFDTKIGMKQLKVLHKADEKVYVYADMNMVNLVIRNLLSNSIKFCAPGDEIILNAEQKGSKVLFMIKDTGPGISEDEQAKLFNLEHTVSAGTQGEKGNHLGLILCKDMVEQNNGRIWFESAPGAGTTFWVELPSADDQSIA